MKKMILPIITAIVVSVVLFWEGKPKNTMKDNESSESVVTEVKNAVLEVELREFGNDSTLKFSAKIQNIDGRTVLLASISGDLSGIDFPEISQTPKREYGLWETGCFEIFVSGGGASYTEYNFGFNQNYEKFAFSAYRRPQPPPEIPNSPKITVEIKENMFTQHVELSEDIVSGRLFSVTAAVKLKNGNFLYFANKHCGEKPDFHLKCPRNLRLAESQK